MLRPRALPEGGTIGICSPAGPVDAEDLEWGTSWLASEGFQTKRSAHVFERAGYLAGSDELRRDDFLTLLRDPAVDAIVYSRGGYGTARWLESVDADELREARKPIVGHSDATILSLFATQRAGLVSIHGPMLQRSDLTHPAKARLLDTLMGRAASTQPLYGKPLRGGCVTAPLIGGNLTMITSSLGTPWEIEPAGCILFLEDVAEQPYAIDRQLQQLQTAGKLEAVVGVALGRFENCDSPRYPECTALDVLHEMLGRACSGPIVCDLPFGHIADNRALAVGLEASLDGDRGSLAHAELAVETSRE